jgi:hypothetical protein
MCTRLTINDLKQVIYKNTEGFKPHNRLIIKPIVKRFFIQKAQNTEGVSLYNHTF